MEGRRAGILCESCTLLAYGSNTWTFNTHITCDQDLHAASNIAHMVRPRDLIGIKSQANGGTSRFTLAQAYMATASQLNYIQPSTQPLHSTQERVRSRSTTPRTPNCQQQTPSASAHSPQSRSHIFLLGNILKETLDFWGTFGTYLWTDNFGVDSLIVDGKVFCGYGFFLSLKFEV